MNAGALFVLCLLGAAVGVCFAFGLSIIAVGPSTPAGPWFLSWIASPAWYWPWPAFGAVIAALAYLAAALMRSSN